MRMGSSGGGDPDKNRAEYVKSLVSTCAIALAATVLRFWCQMKNERRGFHSFHPDDWLLLATSVTYLGAGAAATYGLVCGEVTESPRGGVSDPEEQAKRANFFKALFIGQTILYLTFFLAKLTVCMLYRRIFTIHHFRRACLYLMIASTVWFIAAEVTNLCICIPVDLFWHPARNGGKKCLNFNLFALIIGVVEVVLDIAILVLPLQVVLGLQMPRRAKVIVSGIFLMGSFSVITNILRVAYQFQLYSDLVNMKNAFIWCVVHGAVTILCACLPVYKPVRDILGTLFSSVQAKYSQLTGRSSPATRTSNATSSTRRTSANNPNRHFKNILEGRDSGTGDISKHERNSMSGVEKRTRRESQMGKSVFPSPPLYDHEGRSDLSGGEQEEKFDEEEDLVLRPGRTYYAVEARHSDLSGEEFLHANVLRGDMSIACTTKVEVV